MKEVWQVIQDIARERVMHKLLERQVAKYGERTYMYFEDNEYSFEQFNDEANRVACGMQKLGIGKGDKVTFVMDNCPEAIFLMFGLSKLGAVAVPINNSHRGEIMTYMVDHSDAGILVMHSNYIEQVAPVLQKTTKIKSVVILPGDDGEQKSGCCDESAVAAEDRITEIGKQVVEWSGIINNDGVFQQAEVVWSDPILLMYTSGTTGVSKGVLLPQNLLYAMAERFRDGVLENNITEDDCIYVNSPLFHAHAWHSGINLSLLTGARMLLAKKFSARQYWDDIKRFGCTYTTAGGARLPILLLAEPKPDDSDNPMKVILGGPASEKLCNAFEPRFGAKIIEFYGSTELGMVMINSVSHRMLGSCGRTHPDFAVKVVDENGVEVGANEPGEILVRPLKPYIMMLEYYKMPDKTAEAWKDLWFHTGDNALIDEEGFFHFVDRKKDSIRRRGENVSSFEVERVINSHPDVLESAAYGVKSELAEDDEVMVSITLKEGRSLLPEALIEHCEGEMAYFMVPRYVRFVENLPKNAVLRVEKYKLRDEGVTEDTWDREKAGYKLKR
jgi:crotonobetaine/carnitine-CoA ligase